MTRVILIICLSCFATLCRGQESIVHVKMIPGDATPEVLGIFLSAMPGKALNITFEKGTYHFYPDKAYEFYRHISNHDDVLARSAFPIVGLDHISIDGQGSTFIFHGRMIPFIIEDSKNIILSNFSIDWATPFHSEGLVVATDEAEGTYDLSFSDEYPYEIRNGNLIFLKEYFEHEMGQAYFYDPEIGGVAHNTLDYSVWGPVKRPVTVRHGKEITYPYPYSFDRNDPVFSNAGKELKSRFEQVDPGVVRVYNHPRKLPEVGFVQVMKGVKPVNRTAPAIHLVGVNNFTARNVDVLHAGGMGVIAEYSADLTLDNLNVIPPEGRLVSATSDATHFIGCRGMIILKECRFSNQLDDGTNIHGAHHPVADILGENQLGIRMGHFQQQSLRVGYPGDTIGIIRKEEGISPFAKLTIRSVGEINSRYAILTVNEVFPEDVNKGDLIENLTAYPEVLISNCEFSRNRAHGIILHTSKPAIIENCLFNGDMGGILIPAGISHWHEAGHPGNVVIRNNTFRDSPYGGSKEACITFRAPGQEPVFRNIKILDNTFNHFNNLILDISNVENCKIAGNMIMNSGTYPLSDPERPAFRFSASTGVTFENNSYKGKASEILETDEQCHNVISQ